MNLINLFPVTSVYAAILGLLLVVFAMRVGAYRASSRVSLGDNNDPELFRRIRAHANFTETVPMALILLALVEASGSAAVWIHVFGATLLVGRVSHWLQLSGFIKPMLFRAVGMLLTIFSVVGTSLWLLLNAIL